MELTFGSIVRVGQSLQILWKMRVRIIRVKFSFGMDIGGVISFSGIVIRNFPNC